MKLKIAVVQFKVNQSKPDINVNKAEQFIKKASELKAKIIIFPEDFITSPLDDKSIIQFADSDFKYRNIFQNLAKKYKIDIIPGTIIERNKVGNFNVCYYIDSSGKVKGRYEKINLWLTERRRIVPGNKICVFNTKFGKIGLAICWDLIFPEIFRKMTRCGAKIIFCPSFWSKSENYIGYKKFNKNAEILHVNSLCKARAIENNIIFIYCNIIGKYTFSKKIDEAIGQSQITAPIIGTIKKAINKKEMFVQEIDTKVLDYEERAYKIRKDLKNRILY